MRSSQLVLEHYDTDKVANRYLEVYDPIFEPYVDKKIKLLVVGVSKGGSLPLWRDYFPHATITGVDIRLPNHRDFGDRIQVFEVSQTDCSLLSEISRKIAPEGFDIIIDDASHIAELTKITFWHLFDNHLKPGGLYAIEDWLTGYWDDWIDGKSYNSRSQALFRALYSARCTVTRAVPSEYRKHLKIPLKSHDYGMVGFIKQRWTNKERSVSLCNTLMENQLANQSSKVSS